jgi:hypothetical protein
MELNAIHRSGECGMKMSGAALRAFSKIQRDNSRVEKGESGRLTSPCLSKTDATLDVLISLRGKEQVPQEMKEVLMRDTNCQCKICA